MGVIALRNFEATVAGGPVARRIDALRVKRLKIELGTSSLGRAVLALPAIDAVAQRFARAELSVSGTQSVVRMLTAHLGQSRPSALPPDDTADLIADFAPGVRRTVQWHERGESIHLKIPSAPYPERSQHASAHWLDGARVAGFEPRDVKPSLKLPKESRERARRIIERFTGHGPIVVLACRRDGFGAERFSRVARELARRIGSQAITLRGELIAGTERAASVGDELAAAATLQYAAVCITDDEDFAQVAAACEAPVLSLHERTCPVRFGPYATLGASIHAVCRTPEQHGASPSRNSRCFACLQEMRVVESAEEIAAHRWPWDRLARLRISS